MALSQEKKGTIAVSLTNFLDSGCIVASGVALAAWAIAFNFDNVWVSILGAVGANAFGAAVGALIGGFLADRFGRKFIYTYNLARVRHGRLPHYVRGEPALLCAGIVISGLSVGAGVPSSWSYISEMSSSTSRAANIGISQFAWSCGPAVIFLIALLFSFIFPTFGPDGALLPAAPTGPSTACSPCVCCSSSCSWWRSSRGICSASWRSRRTGRKSSPRLRASATPSSR